VRFRLGIQGEVAAGIRYRVFGDISERNMGGEGQTLKRWAELELSVPILRNFGGSLQSAAQRRAVIKKQISDGKREVERADIRKRLSAQLIRAVEANERVALLTRLIKSSTELVEWVKRAERDRLVEAAHRLEIEGSRRERQIALLEARSQLETAQEEMKAWLPEGTRLELPPLDELLKELKRASEELETKPGVLLRSELVQLEQVLRSEEQQVELHALKPRLDAVVRLRTGCQDVEVCSEAVAGFEFDMSLSRDVLLQRAQLERALALESQARLRVLECEAQVRVGAIKREINLVEELVREARVSVETANSRLRAERQRLQRGRSSPFEMLRAESDLADVEAAVLANQVRLANAWQELAFGSQP
jgi:outer membrane protein TolC